MMQMSPQHRIVASLINDFRMKVTREKGNYLNEIKAWTAFIIDDRSVLLEEKHQVYDQNLSGGDRNVLC